MNESIPMFAKNLSEYEALEPSRIRRDKLAKGTLYTLMLRLTDGEHDAAQASVVLRYVRAENHWTDIQISFRDRRLVEAKLTDAVILLDSTLQFPGRLEVGGDGSGVISTGFIVPYEDRVRGNSEADLRMLDIRDPGIQQL